MSRSGVEGAALGRVQRRALDWLRLRRLASIAALALGCGCDSDPDAFPAKEACPAFDYSSFEVAADSVSFSADVLPILTNNCTEIGCHGSLLTPASGLYLGPNPSAPTKLGEPAFPADLVTREDIVNSYLLAPARVTRDRPRVMAGDPDQSLLMHKLDGSHACIKIACLENDCGQRMPRGKAQLSAADRDIIRNWIAQGAQPD